MNLEMEGGTKSFYQWDTGQSLAVTGGDTCRQIHFCHRLDEKALVCRIREKDGKRVADVPNILLQKAEQIIAYAYEESAEGGKTLWAKSFAVKPRPKPEDYVYTQTEVLSYEALADRVANLEGEGLSQAVADYLKENPPQAGATAEEAAQIRRNQENIENLSDVKLDASKLPEAVNDALAQAKSSGDFKGEPGDDYVLTEADKQKIAELTAPLVEVPDGGAATMQPLTFTGAVNATYDGSEAVSVEIPVGGGGVTPCGAEKIVDYTVDADGANAKSFTFTVEEYPKLAEYNHLRGIYRKTSNGSLPWVEVALNTTVHSTEQRIGKVATGSYSMGGFDITCNFGFYMGGMTDTRNPTVYPGENGCTFWPITSGRVTPLYLEELTMVTLGSYTPFLDEGGRIEIWGWND